jgi:AmmeMemoRadiSam system protein A
MVPMPSAEVTQEYTHNERAILLGIACNAIMHGLAHGHPAGVHLDELPASLAADRASFVTLNSPGGRLRGCIGSLEAYRPLAEDVSQNAWAAAFRDPRFPPLQEEELNDLDIHVSVLSESQALVFGSEQELLGLIRPGVDGLILQEQTARGTFLPSVWESLPEPTKFLAHLKLKAGLPADYWSGSVRIWRYTTQSFGASAASILDRQATT